MSHYLQAFILPQILALGPWLFYIVLKVVKFYININDSRQIIDMIMLVKPT